MELLTKYFGKQEYQEEELIVFPEGIAGIERFHTCLAIDFGEGEGTMLCLQSTEEPELALVVMNPFQIDQEYSPTLTGQQKKELEMEDEEELSFYVICTVNERAEKSTVNLRAPIVVNVRTRRARQIILEEPYEFRYCLDKSVRKG